ncbi:MAG: hypothetical protein RI947_130 [Candidatus Parcubacteria bacterium]|jgi:ATP-binding cassette subfamily B protein
MKNIGKIITLSKPLHKLVGLLSFLILIGSFVELVSPLLSKYIVDEIVASVQHQGGNLSKLIWLIFIAFLANVVGSVLTSVTERLGDHFAGRLRKFLTEKFYGKVLTLPQSYFDSEISGKIVNQLNRGISTIQIFMNTSSNFMLPMFLQSFLTIAVLMYYSIPVAVFTFILFPIYLVLSHYSAKKWGEEELKKNKIEDSIRGRIHEVISNIRLVKSFNNEKNEFGFISKNLSDSNTIYARQSRTFHIFNFYRNISLNIILAAINVIVFYNTFKGTLTIGEMVLILQLVNQARRPLFAMSFILSRIQEAESGSKEYIEIMDLQSTEHFDTQYDQKKVKNPEIEFNHVSFKYDTSQMVLKDVTFKIAKNETVALVGHSGVGKSTIVNLILKFYNPTEGSIRMNGSSYEELNHRFIRNNIALVFQENELFSSTIRNNIAYGHKADEKDIIKALKQANAYDFVMKLPQGIDSEVGERGVRLSGGQKQRIQIARAILKDAPILILDEATSSLDSKSENEVQEALENLMKDRLVIIIAHRFSTIQNTNKILVVDNGEIVDSGSPKELSMRPGIYADLLKYQVEGNKKLLQSFDLY